MPFESVVDVIAGWVRRTPEAPAIYVDGEVVCSYAQLWRRAQCYAGHLVAQGVAKDDLVGIQMPRSAEYLCALLGVWCSGAAWVYLDPQWPQERIDAVLEDGQVQVVLRGGEEGVPPEAPARLSAQDLAYGFWTSGSTGRPKGVLVEHGGLPSMLRQQVQAFGLGPGMRALLVLKASFDASVSDIGTAWLSGAAVAVGSELQSGLLTPSALRRAVTTCQATHVDLPPSLLPSLQALPDCVQTVIIGGEVAGVHAVRRWSKRVRLVSVYGPTEATVCTSMVRASSSWRSGAIGEAMHGVLYSVRDAQGRVLPEDAEGELWIGGVQVARGYVAQPELTAQRFLIRDGERWFRTRDRVRRRHDGTHDFLGRIDRQFKLHGQLIAPEEVEALLLETPEVRRARVALHEGVLTAVLQPREASTIDGSGVRARLSACLPSYLVPQRVCVLEAWPLTDSGKVDESRLWSSLPSTPSSRTEGGLLVELASDALARAARYDQGLLTQGADSLALIRFVASCEAAGLSPRMEDLVADLPLDQLDVGAGADEGLDVEVMQGRLRDYAPPPIASGPRAGELWLYTGATGSLGSRVLLRHLEVQPDLQAVLLVRARDEAHARRRVEAAWAKHGTRAGDWPSGLQIMLGDLCEPRLGLSASQYKFLLKHVSLVHHLAAQVHSLAPLDVLWPSNVAGTEALLQLALDAGVRRFVYASTLSVFVGTDRGLQVAYESDDLSGSYRLFGGYAQSKWAAERAVLRASKAGLRVVQLRYGLITPGLQAGAWPERDQLRQLLAGLSELGLVFEALNDTELAIDLTPADWAAQVAIAIAQSEQAQGAYHVSGATVTLSEWLGALRAQGVELRQVSSQVFAEQAAHLSPATRLTLLSLSRALSPQSRHRGVDLLQATGIRFDDRRTHAVMQQEGLRYPRIDAEALQDYVQRVVERSS